MQKKQSLIIIILIYTVTAFLWFYIANNFIFEKIKTNSGVGFWLKESEDLIFVVFTSILLYVLIRRNQKQWLQQELLTKNKEEALTITYLERFNAVTAATNDVLWDWDIENNKVWRNENFGKLLGYPSGETVLPELSDWINYMHEDDRQGMKDLLEKALSGTDTYLEGEYRIITKDKRVLNIRDISHIYRDENGKALRIVGAMQDITSLRTSQLLLQKSEEHYRKIVETAHEGIWQIDENGFTTFVNPALTEMLGYTKEDMHGKLILDFVFEEDVQAAKDKMKLHLKGEKLQFEFKLKQKNGKAIWILAKGSPVFEEGLYKGSIGMISDISAIKEFTKKIQESELNYKLLFKENPMPIWVFSLEDYSFLAVNNAALKHYGYTREEFLKLKVTQIRPESEVEKFIKFNRNENLSIRNAGLWKHLKKNGEIIDVEIVTQRIVYDGIDAHMVLINDVTSKLKAEKELLKSYEEIRKLAIHLQTVRDDERKRIARDIHDELGQKLTAVKMNLAWLDKQNDIEALPVKQKLKETLMFTDESNHSIRKILNELRSEFLSRFGTGEALKWQAEQFEKQTGIKVQLTIDEDIDELDSTISSCLYRVLQESLTNIIKHAEAKHVEVLLKKQKDTLLFTIKDDGSGFSKHTVNSDISFGLLGIKERVAGINGSFELQTEPGKGTGLYIQIPMLKTVTV